MVQFLCACMHAVEISIIKVLFDRKAIFGLKIYVKVLTVKRYADFHSWSPLRDVTLHLTHKFLSISSNEKLTRFMHKQPTFDVSAGICESNKRFTL